MLERNSLIQRFKKKSTPVPLALESDIIPRSQLSNPFKIIPGFLGNMNFSRFAATFQAGGDVNCITPNVEGVARGNRNQRSGMDTDAQFPAFIAKDFLL